jgi:hypothetical protein
MSDKGDLVSRSTSCAWRMACFGQLRSPEPRWEKEVFLETRHERQQTSSPRIGTSAHSTRLHQQRCVGGDGCDARVRVGAWVAVVSLSRCLTLHPKTNMSQRPLSLEDIVDAVARAYDAPPVVVDGAAQFLNSGGDLPTPSESTHHAARAERVVVAMMTMNASTEAESPSPAHHGSQKCEWTACRKN